MLDVSDQIVSEPQNKYMMIGSFTNENGISCYANSLVQCLLSLIPCKTIKNIGIFKDLSHRHQLGELHTTKNRKHAVGGTFSSKGQA